METIAFFNLKGGVGKTTSAVNIAWHAANEGIPTLLWDLDPQGAATWLLNKKRHKTGSPDELLSGNNPIGNLVKATSHPNLSLIPADFSFRHIDQRLAAYREQGVKNAISSLIEPFSEQYALMILDCPPSFSLLTEQVFETASSLYIPIIPTYLSLRTFEQTQDFFKEKKLKPKRLHAFFTMVDIRRNLHRAMLQHPPKMLKHGLPTPIPYAAVIEKMGEYRAPLPSFNSSSNVSKAYARLWQDVKKTLNNF